MNKSNRLNLLLKSGLVAFSFLLIPNSVLSQGNNPPESWKPEDVEVVPQHFTLEIESFPSRMFAASIAQSIEDMGWSPVRLTEADDEFKVYYGYFEEPASARYYQLALEDQKIAEPEIIELRPSEAEEFRAEKVFADLDQPFQNKRGLTDKWVMSEENRDKIQNVVNYLPEDEGASVLASWNVATSDDVDEMAQAQALADVLKALVDQKRYPELTYYLALPIASGELPASDQDRILARETVADLEYGHFRDWKAAWASSNALLRESKRSEAGKVRDHLRKIALQIELERDRVPGVEIHWENIRSQLRQIYDMVPVEQNRLMAKVELVYLQTFAWEGDWDRVAEVGANFITRHQTHVGEVVLARFYYARSFERTGNYEAALAQLRLIEREYPTYSEALFLGYNSLDVNEQLDRWRTYFEEKQLEAKEYDAETSDATQTNE